MKVARPAATNAIATTSGGVAWSLGYQDGEKAPWDEVIAATGRIARAVAVPVTADIEAGYSHSVAVSMAIQAYQTGKRVTLAEAQEVLGTATSSMVPTSSAAKCRRIRR